ncbi:unnamed protein product, partial [Cyprideis torosa]
MNAAEKVQLEKVSLLLRQGAQVNAEDGWKRTPLLLAIRWRSSPSKEETRLKCVKVLLQAGANIRHCDEGGNNALHYATFRRYPSIAQHLLTVDPSLCLVKNFAEETALHVAADQAQPAIISILLQYGARVDGEDNEERTPLLSAIGRWSPHSQEEPRLECVKLLLQAGANIRLCDKNGNNALHRATKCGYLSIAQHLLTVDPSLCLVKNSFEETALHVAADQAQPAIISILLQYGARVDGEDNEERTPLLLAIGWESSPSQEEERMECVKILLEWRARIDCYDKDKNNAMHYASHSGYKSIVRHLLFSDSSLATKKNKEGKTSADMGNEDFKVLIRKVVPLRNKEKALLDVVIDVDMRYLVPDFISSLAPIDVKNSEGKMPYELVEDDHLKTLLCPYYRENHRYSLVTFIGKGSFGSVYKVTHNVSENALARKLIPIDNTSERDRTLVAREIRAMRRVDHPNVVKLVEFWREVNDVVIIMELCEQNLDQWLCNYRRPEDRDREMSSIQKLFVDISGGVAYIQSKGFIHRDLKPSNILLNGSGNSLVAKIADLGLGRLEEGNSHDIQREMFFGLMTDASFGAMSLIPNVSRLLRESHIMIKYMMEWNYEERPTSAEFQVLQENSGPRGAQVEPRHLNETSDEEKDWNQDLNKPRDNDLSGICGMLEDHPSYCIFGLGRLDYGPVTVLGGTPNVPLDPLSHKSSLIHTSEHVPVPLWTHRGTSVASTGFRIGRSSSEDSWTSLKETIASSLELEAETVVSGSCSSTKTKAFDPRRTHSRSPASPKTM